MSELEVELHEVHHNKKCLVCGARLSISIFSSETFKYFTCSELKDKHYTICLYHKIYGAGWLIYSEDVILENNYQLRKIYPINSSSGRLSLFGTNDKFFNLPLGYSSVDFSNFDYKKISDKFNVENVLFKLKTLLVFG